MQRVLCNANTSLILLLYPIIRIVLKKEFEMRRSSIKSLVITAAAAILFSGCGDSDNGTDSPAVSPDELPQEVKDTLAYMGNEERLAHDVYLNLYNFHKDVNGIDIPQLYNIATNSETKHISIVQSLVQAYNITVSDLSNVDENVINENGMSPTNMPSGVYDVPRIQELYDMLYAKGVNSQQDALEVGCMVEVTDIDDLNKYIQEAQALGVSDIQTSFETLREGSYSHYWAFDAGLKSMGIADGCCSLGTIDGVNYCHPEYPQNSGKQRGR